MVRSTAAITPANRNGRKGVSVRQRKPLTRDRVLKAALRYIDRRGVDALSMRLLARELHVEAMALYRYATNKEDLLRGVLELVLSEIELPDEASLGWKDWLRAAEICTRKVYLRHPNVLPIALKYSYGSEKSQIRSDRTLGVIVGAGFNGDDVHHLSHQLGNHLFGSLIFSQFTRYRRSGNGNRSELPFFSEYVEYFAGCNNDLEFEFGLDLILDAFESRLHRGI